MDAVGFSGAERERERNGGNINFAQRERNNKKCVVIGEVEAKMRAVERG